MSRSVSLFRNAVDLLRNLLFHRSPLKPKFRRAAHYFGDHSPIGFWVDQDLSRVPQQLARIRDDDFDTVILVINWPLFQTNLSDEQLNPWFTDRLHRVLIDISRAKLSAMFRVGFMHQPQLEKPFGLDRPLGLFYGTETRQAFARMIHQLNEVAELVHGVEGMFFSWEDMWGAMESMPHQSSEQRLRLARESEYQKFLRTQKSLTEVSRAYGIDFESINDVPIPNWGTPAMSMFIAFFDYVMRETIVAGRTHYRELMPELRVDAAPVTLSDGNYDWLHHDPMIDLSPRAAYWGPFYGAKNVGEEITADEAIASMKYLLTVADSRKHKDLFVEQFNFFENHLTMASCHARLAADQWERFFDLAADLFASSFLGYGVWTARDYRENWFVNASFQQNLAHWKTTRASHDPDGLKLSSGGTLSQAICPEAKAHAPATAYKKFRIEIYLDKALSQPNSMKFVVGRHELVASLNVQRDIVSAEFDVSLLSWSGSNEIAITNESEHSCVVTRAYVYGFVQSLGLYDEYGNEGRFAPQIRRLNSKLNSSRT
jgi:hypothetical protein